MKYNCFLLLMMLLLANPLFASKNPLAAKEVLNNLAQRQSIAFTENKGQMTDMNGRPVPFVLFRTSVPGMDMYVTEKGLTYLFLKTQEEEEDAKPLIAAMEKAKENDSEKIEWERIDMMLDGASIKKENIIAEQQSADFSQYFLPHCPDGITNVHSFKKITIKDVYPAIDWVLYNSDEKGFKYDFIVHPGANPAQIRMVYSALDPLEVNNNGDLILKSKLGTLQENAPYSYIKESNREVLTKFQLADQQYISSNSREPYYQTTITFKLSNRSASNLETIVIDPQLYWATFYGGNGVEGPMSAVTDISGNLFLSGYTGSAGFPVQTAGTFYQGTIGGGVADIFIMKISNVGTVLWSTYYGGSSVETGSAIAIDGSNNIFITGHTTSSDLPVQNAGTFYQATIGSAATEDLFILKFDNAGNRLWASYYGGSANDVGDSICTDASGNIFVTGYTNSTDFPVLNGGTFYQASNGGSYDAFILKFNNTGTRLWASYYGGSADDFSNAITTDNNGNVFIIGNTSSSNLPVQNAGTFYQGTHAAGFYDAFILEFDNAGTRIWATYYGGSGFDVGNCIATDSNGNIFVTGTTSSLNFPIQNAGTFYQGTFGGFEDVFILKFDAAANRLWGSYYGGSAGESILTNDNLIVDPCGIVYFVFETFSTDIPTQASCNGGYFDNSYNGGRDIFITQFSNGGSLLWATYFGGDGNDLRSPIAFDNSRNLFMAGEWTIASGVITNSTYPVTDPGSAAYVDSTFNGGSDDMYITKFNRIPAAINTSSVNAGCACSGSATVSVTGACPPYDYFWSNGNQTLSTTNTSDMIAGLCPGTYTIAVQAGCDTLQAIITISTGGGSPPNASAGPPLTLNCTVTSDTINVNSTTPGVTYTWNGPGIVSGDTTSSPVVNAVGVYTVTVTDPASGCINTATVSVTSNTSPPDATAGSSVALDCSATSDTISVSSVTPGVTYNWNGPGIVSGDTTFSPIVNLAGIYTVTVTDPANGCVNTATVNVTSTGIPPNAVAGSPLTLNCSITSGTINVSSSTPGVTYNWNGPGLVSGGNTAMPTVNVAGAYTVTVTDSSTNCINTVTVNVSNDNTAPLITVSDDMTIVSGSSVALSAGGGNSYLWSPSAGLSCTTCANPMVSPTATTTYSVTGTGANGCSNTAFVTITIDVVCGSVFVPSVFSPNNDGTNDLYCVFGKCIQSIEFSIFNRWGEKVFETQDPTQCWDGFYKGKKLNTAVFVYYLHVKLINGEENIKKGNISLIR